MKIIRISMAAAAAVLAIAAAGQDTGQGLSLTLADAMQMSVSQNRQVANSRLDIEIAKRKIQETRAIGLPQVSAEAAYTHIFKVPQLDFSSMMPAEAQQDPAGGQAPAVSMGERNTASFTLSVSQLIFSGEYIVGLRASKAYKQFAELGLENMEEDIKQTVGNSYFAALVTAENLRLLDSSLVLAASSASELEAMFSAGFADKTDSDQMQLNLAALRNQRLALERQLDVAMRSLKFNLGIELDSSLVLGQSLSELIAGQDAAAASPVFSAENNTQLKLMHTNEELMLLNKQRHQAAYLPSLAAFYQHKGYIDEPAFMLEPKDIAGLSLTVPIFTSGMRHSRVQQAKLEVHKAANDKENTRQAILLQQVQAYSDMENAMEAYETEQRRLELATRIFSQHIARQKMGAATSMDVTAAQRQAVEAQMQYAAAAFELLRSQLAVRRAFGKI
jgi:outer membrane protein